MTTIEEVKAELKSRIPRWLMDDETAAFVVDRIWPEESITDALSAIEKQGYVVPDVSVKQVGRRRLDATFTARLAGSLDESRCRNCRHWREPSEFERVDEAHPLSSKRICAQASEGKEDAPAIAVCMGEGGIDGELLTSPDFGCVLFEARGKEETG